MNWDYPYSFSRLKLTGYGYKEEIRIMAAGSGYGIVRQRLNNQWIA